MPLPSDHLATSLGLLKQAHAAASRHLVFDVRLELPAVEERTTFEGLRAMTLAGALRNVGRATLADQVRDTMRTAGYTVAETDPFAGARAPPGRAMCEGVIRQSRETWPARD